MPAQLSEKPVLRGPAAMAPALLAHVPGPTTRPRCALSPRSLAWIGCLATLLTLLLLLIQPAGAQTIRQDLYVANADVYTAVESAGVLYIGGLFSRVGPATGSGVPINGTTGAPIATYPKVAGGDVRVVVPDGAGGWYVGGEFTYVSGVPRAHIARILADGTLSPWNPSADNNVVALAVSGGLVYAGGQFTNIGGAARNNIAELDATTGLATSWNPNANNSVSALAVSGGTVYAGGQFTNIGAQTRNHIAALSSVNGTASGWNPNANFVVLALVVSGSTVYAGGAFSTMGVTTTRNGIAALDASTGLATAWNPNATGSVWALALSGSTVYAAGTFTNIGGQPRNFVAALSSTSGLATAWNPNANNGAYALAVSGTTVYTGGFFSSIGGQARNNVAALDVATGAATTWNPNANGLVEGLAVNGSTVYVGGNITSMGAASRRFIAALDATTGAVTPWNPTAYDVVYTLAVSGGIVYAGGMFFSIGGPARNYIAALDATTGAATPWDPSADGGVHVLAVSGSTVYVGGSFNTIGGATRNRIAALDATTGLATPWNPNANDWVLTVVPSGGTVYAGGRFSNIGGQTRNHLAALSATTGLAMPWNPNADGEVDAMAISGGTVYVGGDFFTMGVLTRNHIAALDGTTGAVTGWDPNADLDVIALALSGGTVYAGGWFTNIGGQLRSHLAALDATTGAATSWNPNPNTDVNTLALSGGVMYAGGAFTSMSGLPASYIAGISTNAACITPSLQLTLADVDHDAGGRIRVDWSTYTAPVGTTEYRIVRATDPCTLVNSGLLPLGTVAEGAPKQFIDATATNFTDYYYALRVVGAGGVITDILYAGPVVSHPDLLINEFSTAISPKRQPVTSSGNSGAAAGAAKANAAKVGEMVEIRNLASASIDLTGFRLSNGPGAPVPDEEVLSGSVVPGALFVRTLSFIDLPEAGGTLALLPPVGSNYVLDIVAYGTAGGAPAVPPGFSISRVEGTKASDPNATSFETGPATFGVTNTVPLPDLGHSIVMNEVFTGSNSGGDYIELYNPLGSAVVLDQFAISDGVGFLTTLSAQLQLAPGQLLSLQQNAAGSFTQNLTNPLLYLYKVTASGQYQRVDQLGWTGGPPPSAPNDALCRVPDGLAVFLGAQGANWADCGGGTTLKYGPHTPGLPNRDPAVTQVVVDATGAGNYTTIAAALAAVGAGTRVLVNAGTYPGSFALKDGVEVRGAAVNPAQVIVTGVGAVPIVSATGVGPTAVLAGLTVKNGNAPQGGGLLVTNASPTVRNVRFEQNRASTQGGAVAVVSGNPTFVGCFFYKNSSSIDGGAVAVTAGSPQFGTSLFVLNTAAQRGGALFAAGGSTNVQSCVLDRNSSSTTGMGVVHSAGGVVSLSYSAITNDLQGAPLKAEGGGSTGHISFGCGDMFGHPEWFNMAAGGIDTVNVVVADPLFCQPLALNYAYPNGSPLAPLAARCGQNIGVAGPPCATVATGAQSPPAPLVTRLLPPVPNPFNPATTLRFELAVAGKVSLTLYDVRGRRVAELVGGVRLETGAHEAVWTGQDGGGRRVASGVYFARLALDDREVGEPQRLVLLK